MRKSVICVVLLVSVLGMFVSILGEVSAIDVDTSGNTTRTTVDVSDAVDLYAYEVNFSIDSGSVTTPGSSSFYPFLANGGTTSKGGNQRNGYLYVYESRLDSSHTGVSGSGNLFNITHSADAELTLRGATFVDADGNIEYKSYNVPQVCGNGVVESPEECDDGDTTSGDGCSSTCEEEEEDDGESGTGGGSATIIYRNTTNATERNLIYRESDEITTEPEDFNLNIVQGVEAEREFMITYTGDEAIEVELDADGDMSRAVGFEDSEVTLYDGERRVRFGVLINSNGLKTGNILIIRGNVILKKIPIIANVRSEDFLFDVKMEIPEQFQRIYSGENVYSNIEMKQVGPQLKVDVVANYIVKDLEGNSYYEDSETYAVLGEKIYSKEFTTTSLRPGKYVAGLELVYPGAFAVSSAQFEVLNRGALGLGENAEWILTGAGILIVVCGMVIIWALRKRRKLKKFKRK